MAVAMKGLLKGLRFISHIFEEAIKLVQNAEEEREMQIGGPTDVRHVAHIGWDGPAASPPSWMDKYRGEGELESLSPARDSIQTGSESVEESPSNRRTTASKSMESKAHPSKQLQKKKKKKGSSRTSAKVKTGHLDETGSEPDLEAG